MSAHVPISANHITPFLSATFFFKPKNVGRLSRLFLAFLFSELVPLGTEKIQINFYT